MRSAASCRGARCELSFPAASRQPPPQLPPRSFVWLHLFGILVLVLVLLFGTTSPSTCLLGLGGVAGPLGALRGPLRPSYCARMGTRWRESALEGGSHNGDGRSPAPLARRGGGVLEVTSVRAGTVEVPHLPPLIRSPLLLAPTGLAAASVPNHPVNKSIRDLPIFRCAEPSLRPPPSPCSLSPLLRHVRWRACDRPAAALWRPLEAPGGQLKGQRRLELGPGLPCLALAGAPEPQGPPLSTCLFVSQGGRRGWSSGLATPGQDERIGRARGPWGRK